MNIKGKVLYCFFYNQILIVIPLYVLSFSQIDLVSHSHLFSFVSKEKNINYFCSHLSTILFHSRKNKEEGSSLSSHLIVKY